MQYLSASLEDYLEIIYILQERIDKVGITDISRALSVSKPGASRAVSALKNKDLAVQEHYGKIRLTPQGMLRAQSVYEKHKIISRFLTQRLGVDERTAEIDACKIEHVLSHKTIEGIRRFLKNP